MNHNSAATTENWPHRITIQKDNINIAIGLIEATYHQKDYRFAITIAFQMFTVSYQPNPIADSGCLKQSLSILKASPFVLYY